MIIQLNDECFFILNVVVMWLVFGWEVAAKGSIVPLGLNQVQNVAFVQDTLLKGFLGEGIGWASVDASQWEVSPLEAIVFEEV